MGLLGVPLLSQRSAIGIGNNPQRSMSLYWNAIAGC